MHDVYELDVRPADDLDTGWLSEDWIEYGTPPREWAWQFPNVVDRLPRVPTGLIVGALVLVLGVAVSFSALHPSRVRASAAAPPSPSPVAETTQTIALSQMEAIANSPIPLADYVIADSAHPGCPPMPAGRAGHVAAMVQVVELYQPGFTLKDAELGSMSSGVCAATLRFVNPLAATMVVSVVAPPNSFTPFDVTAITDFTGARDVGTVLQGWRVEVGIEGNLDSLIGETDLLAVATDARLRWSVS